MAAALKADRAVTCLRDVLAIEMLCSVQALDLLAPLATSPALARVAALVRTRVPTLDDDRPPAPDIASIAQLIASGELEAACGVGVK
jgi:histidine ammonia-lyase